MIVPALIGTAFLYQRTSLPTTRYITAEVMAGSLTVSATARGHLQPRKQVDIGSEISGTVRTVNVDVNDTVRAGQVLAVLDTSRLQAQLARATSAVASARARVAQADAKLEAAATSHARLLKLHELSGHKLPSQRDLDVADAAFAREQGAAAAARAGLAQAQANREAIETDLSKAEIRSPIDGVVLIRSIEPGQTIAASLQAPVLFTLAEDLRQMELRVAVDEADIGSVQLGQDATFSVDAFPDRDFSAQVTQVHLASNRTRTAASGAPRLSGQAVGSSAGVVTYETVLAVDNAGLLLRPGMTATAQIATATLEGVTLVTNAAMRFIPEQAQLPGAPDASERGTGIMLLVPYLADRWRCPRESGQALGCVWVLENGRPALAIFKAGATDRSLTQVLDLEQLPAWRSLARQRSDRMMKDAIARKLRPGMRVIVDTVTPRETIE